MRKLLFWAAIAMLLLAPLAFGQSRNASLSGTVEDAQGGVLPGVEITATNNATGVVSTQLTNDVGVYNFPSLTPGTYNVSAELPSFQTTSFKDVLIGNAAQVRLNIKMQVAGLEETVEVSVDADQLLLESSSSVGDVLTESEVEDLPRVNNNVLDLVKVMAGASISGDAIFGEAFGYGGGQSTFAGVTSANINVQRDGIPLSDVRQPTGLNSPTRLNPDLVGEFRIVLAPVDAEAGRGNGQVQIATRGGTNDFHGNLSWNVQNTALDPNTWQNNRSGIEAPWRNLNEYTASIGGPIIKNKTFFFVLWNQQIPRNRINTNVLVLTPCASNGVFRYFDNWNNGNTQTTLSTADATRPSVDASGNPVTPTTNPDGSVFKGRLHYTSVFGEILNEESLNADCSNAIVDETPWDQYRTGMDPTGYITEFIGAMPDANNWEIGDGLNTAGHRWSRTDRGADNLYGVGEDTNRKQINFRIDHNFSDKHRISGNWSFEKDWADDNFATWPTGYGGRVERQPQVLAINFTSSLTPTLLNEVTMGMSRTGTNVYSPLTNPETGDKMRALMPERNGAPIVIGPGSGVFNFGPEAAGAGMPSNPYGSRGFVIWDLIDSSPRWTFGDTVSWARGAHSFKWGAEFRRSTSYGAQGWNYQGSSFVPIPIAAGGATQFSTITGINGTAIPGLAGDPSTGNVSAMMDMLNLMSGSVSQVKQYYYINSPDQAGKEWSDHLVEPLPVRDFQQREFAAFFKDDWKVTPNITLNLGLRYEYYGVPYLKNGMTPGLVDGGSAIYGISGRSWEEAFWNPGERDDLTRIIFVGPDSPHPNQEVYNRDMNNFGPAVGFAYTPSWFGQGKTTIRGGYQLSYLPGRAGESVGVLTNVPGSTYLDQYTGSVENPYLNLTSVGSMTPIPEGVVPMSITPLTSRVSSITVFDPNIRTPYAQNITLAVTHNLSSNITFDVRYVGTLSRKLINNVNINAPNFLNNDLFSALTVARMGWENDPQYADETALLDNMLVSVRGESSGAAWLRSSFDSAALISSYAPIAIDLANGDFISVANKLNFMGATPGQFLRDAELPENYIKANPQFNDAQVRTNMGHSNYHSMQAQITLRPTYGLSLQGTYTWSRNLGVVIPGGFTNPGMPNNPLDPAAEYTLLASNRSHVFSTYGSFNLPIGPGKMFFNDTSGVLAKFIEGWQLNWIGNVSSGIPISITASNALYNNNVPDIVNPFDFDSVGVDWADGALTGDYFGHKYTTVADPQCGALSTAFADAPLYSSDWLFPYFCSLKALQDNETGEIVLQNPQPGTTGNFGRNRFNGPRTWSIDMAIAKSITVMEGKKISFRLDASNILNHPQPSYGQNVSGVRIRTANPPSMTLNSNAFAPDPLGTINNKVGTRTFQFMLRFDF